MGTNKAIGESPFRNCDFLGAFGAPSLSFAIPQPPLCGHPRDPPSLPAPGAPHPAAAVLCAQQGGASCGTPGSRFWAHLAPSEILQLCTFPRHCQSQVLPVATCLQTHTASSHIQKEAPSQALLRQPNRATQQKVKASAFNLLDKLVFIPD